MEQTSWTLASGSGGRCGSSPAPPAGDWRVREMPQGAERAAFSAARRGWNAGACAAFRARSDYPAIPTSLAFRQPLPEAPAL